MDAILQIPLTFVSVMATLAGVFAMIGPGGGPPPAAPMLQVSPSFAKVLTQMDQAQRRSTPYASRAAAKVLAARLAV